MKKAIEYGRRLIPQILDDLSSSEPNRIVYCVASFSEAHHEFQHISARSFANAVDKTAWWLHDQLGKPTSVEAVGYIGPHDIRHVILTYACAKAGYTALFLSPKNNTQGALAVLGAAKCNIWVKAREQSTLPLVESFLQARPMKLLEIAEVDDVLDAKSARAFPYIKTFQEAANDPFCILHTSGTTGVPKPVPWSHGLIGTMDAVRLLPRTEGDHDLAPWTTLWEDGDRIYSSFPMSHGAGIIMNILMPSLFGLHCILGPANVLPNLNLVETLADCGKIDIWSMVPSLVDELGETPDVLAKFKASKFICASGGPVSPISAGKVNEVIRVLNLTGTTEGLFIGNLVVKREDWLWFAFHPFSGFEFKEVEPGIFEQWVHRNEHWPLFQGIFHTFPAEQSINLKDLYVKHPTKPDHWAFRGRSDDTVVLSNGFKIAPLDTEAFVTTHPAIDGCLIIGNSKPQAGMLIELKDPSSKDDNLLSSIWSTIEEANALALLKTRLREDYITFAEPDKPFVRTDKGTVKRHATLLVYADYIERFYRSRVDDVEDIVTINTTSLESIMQSVRELLGSSLPAILEASPDTDIFSLGVDSLLVFRATKIIRSAMGLRQDQLAPRYLYANPTLAKFSALLARLAAESKKTDRIASDDLVDDEMVKIKRMIDEHKRRLSFRLNPLDYVNPNHYLGLSFYFSLRQGVSMQDTFVNLQEGLRRTMQLIPALDGKMMVCSEDEMGYRKGDLRLSIPTLPLSVNISERSSPAPRQLLYKDLSHVLPPLEALRGGGFVNSAVRDEILLRENTFPSLPADVLVAQANFVKGGCILAANFHHCCLDGIGVMVALRVWAESCRFVQGDMSATCGWLDPESFNHSLPNILYEQEGYARPAHKVDPGVWGFLPFSPPERSNAAEGTRTSEGTRGNSFTNGIENHETCLPATEESDVVKQHTLPPPPKFHRKFTWPPPPVAHNGLSTSMFLIPPEKVQNLNKDVAADPAANGTVTSISDIVQAFFWRSAIKARYRVAKELHGSNFGSDELSILELPVDGRPYFSSLLPSSYMGSMLILNRPNMLLETLCSSKTSIAHIALVLREAAARITPSLVHDAFTLMESLPDYSNNKFSLACMGLDSMHAMISNLMLFQTSDISFGDAFFGNGGSPEALRPLVERGHKRFRFLVIQPMRSDGGVELVLGTTPEELEMLTTDEEFTRYAKLVDSC